MEFITEKERVYSCDENGRIIAEITFPSADGVATIDHTYVDGSLRGQGVAGQLMQLAVDKIKADGNKLAATCSYAIAWLQRHPEYEVVNLDAPMACRIDGRH